MQSENSSDKTGGLPWGRIALVGSLALNLALAGVLFGAWSAGPKPKPPSQAEMRGLGVGTIGRALSKEDRQKMRQAFVERRPRFDGSRRDIRRSLRQMVALLRADSFDAAAFQAELERQGTLRRSAQEGMQKVGAEVLTERVSDMSDAERGEFADKLEQALQRGGKRKP